ncbi:MAG: BON domain-containing protein [Bacteriovoracaceae bacterium]
MKILNFIKLLVSFFFFSVSAQFVFADSSEEWPDSDKRITKNDIPFLESKFHKSDLALTKKIRESLIADKNLSTSAHNVKIITYEGQVRIKGRVISRVEERNVLKKARSVAGESNVTNEITIIK